MQNNNPSENLTKNKIKSIIESLLFINERPIEMAEFLGVLEVNKKEIENSIEELIGEYIQRKSGISIVKVAGGYQMCSAPDSEPWVKRMYQERGKQKLSTASLETLAIIAYKQPVTRIEIEAIRGVNIDGVVRKLSELGLIKIGGRKDVAGRPFLYITTRKFLEYFGINSLKDLPKLEDFVALAEKDQAMINPDEVVNNADSKNDEILNEQSIDNVKNISEEEEVKQ